MISRITFDFQEDILRVLPFGSIETLDEGMSYTHLFLSEADTKGFNKVILDDRALQLRLDMISARRIIEGVTEACRPYKGLRIATVNAHNHLEIEKLLEKVLRDNFIMYKTCTQEYEALNWLIHKTE